MPICRGRSWPNAPRSHQGGRIERPWPWVIHCLPPPPFGIANPWPNGLDLLPAPITGPFDPPTWTYAETDWLFTLAQVRDGVYGAYWRALLQVEYLPGPSTTSFDSPFSDVIPSIQTLGFVEWAAQVGTPGFWFTGSQMALSATLYGDLPADFCTGA